MYGLESSGSLLVAIIGIAMIIVFFMMSARLKKISEILEAYSDVEFKKPEYQNDCDILALDKPDLVCGKIRLAQARVHRKIFAIR